MTDGEDNQPPKRPRGRPSKGYKNEGHRFKPEEHKLLREQRIRRLLSFMVSDVKFKKTVLDLMDQQFPPRDEENL